MLTPQDLRQISETVSKALEHGKDELLNTKKCAEWLGISVNTLQKRCCDKAIPYHKKGGLLFFSKNEITKYYLAREGGK